MFTPMLRKKPMPILFHRLATVMIAIVCLGVFGTQPVHALKSDREQPADIQADDTEIDFKTGTRTFINNVLAVQGTLRLKADKLVAIYNDGELEQATMWGNLARFKQRPDGKPDDVQGWAKKIIVNQKANTLTLIGKAALQQGPSTARGDTIVYNMATDTLKVQSGRFGQGGKDGQIRPNKKIEDPFADDNAPPPESAPTTKTPVTAKNEGNVDSSDKQSTDTNTDKKQSDSSEQWVPPTQSGRSRLILQPRKKPKEEENDSEENDVDADDEDSDTDEETSDAEQDS